MKYSLLLFVFVSCSLFKVSNLSDDIVLESKRVCLNADGNGRLLIQGHKYVFGFETLFDEENSTWQMALNFPLYGEEFIELSLNDKNTEFNQRLEDKILKERKGVNPILLHQFMTSWAQFLKELIHLQRNEQVILQAHYSWRVENNKLKASRKTKLHNIDADFYNAQDEFFSRMDFSLRTEQSRDPMQIELIVRKCLNDENKM